jgi:hypothetical protein
MAQELWVAFEQQIKSFESADDVLAGVNPVNPDYGLLSQVPEEMLAFLRSPAGLRQPAEGPQIYGNGVSADKQCLAGSLHRESRIVNTGTRQQALTGAQEAQGVALGMKAQHIIAAEAGQYLLTDGGRKNHPVVGSGKGDMNELGEQ